MLETVKHIPVLKHEALQMLRIRPGGVYVDCTVGLGGHAEAILELLQGSGRLIGLDRDPSALEQAQTRLAACHENFRLYHEDFRNLPGLLARLEIGAIDGCLVDLGISSLQIDDPGRGFSFKAEGPLDMRMDPGNTTTAAHLINTLSAEDLADIFRRYGEERQSRRIASEIVRRRGVAPLRTTTELARLVEAVKPAERGGRGRIHPATRVFQALRIAVNQELTGLGDFLQAAIGNLKESGRLVVISFHSLEDRIVKRTFRLQAGRCICFLPAERCICPRIQRIRLLNARPTVPGKEELDRNPRARSARLRAVEKLGGSDSSARVDTKSRKLSDNASLPGRPPSASRPTSMSPRAGNESPRMIPTLHQPGMKNGGVETPGEETLSRQSYEKGGEEWSIFLNSD